MTGPRPFNRKLDLGKLVELGTSEEVYAAPRHPYTAGLIESIPVPDPDRERTKTYLTRFIGRESEIADLVARLQTARLLTVSGMGGAGKTRLAIEVAKRWRSLVLAPP